MNARCVFRPAAIPAGAAMAQICVRDVQAGAAPPDVRLEGSLVLSG